MTEDTTIEDLESEVKSLLLHKKEQLEEQLAIENEKQGEKPTVEKPKSNPELEKLQKEYATLKANFDKLASKPVTQSGNEDTKDKHEYRYKALDFILNNPGAVTKAASKKTFAGSQQSDWTDTDSLLPVAEWANEIIGEGWKKMPFPTIIKSHGMMKHNNKRAYYLLSKITTDTSLWATGVTAIRNQSTYETPLDYDTGYIDPVEYRTMTPVAWAVMDEIDFVGLEADLRKNLGYLAAQKINWVLYTAFGDTALDSAYDWQEAGNDLDHCNDNTVDYGDSFTADNLKSGLEKIIEDLYTPTDCILPPALYIDLLHESQFMNAAQYGSQNSAILQGQVPDFMGISFWLDQHIPDDSSDKDVGFLIDANYFVGLNIAKDSKVDYDNHYDTGEHEFFLDIKAGAKVFRETAGCAFYS